MSDQLEFVRSELERHSGMLIRVAKETGLSYDTVLRVKNGEGDPGYSKVRVLSDYFGYRCNKEAA